MLPTFIAAIIAILVIGFWRQGVSALMAVVSGALVLGGSAALLLPAIGGTSVSPAHFALLGPLLWVVLQRDQVAVIAAISANRWLMVFAVYGVISAFVLPRLFAGQMYVIPMRPTGNLEPLGPAPQNLTQGIYLFGTLVAAILASYAARFGTRPGALFIGILCAGFLHFAFGLLDLAGAQPVLDFFRNANYAQLDQDFGQQGFIRIAGSFPEASQFATFGFGILVVCVELWLRNLWPRISGAVALLTAVMLVLSTSSTAFICLAIYAVLMVPRLLFFTSGERRLAKALTLAGLGIATVAVVLVLVAVNPTAARAFQDIVEMMTTEKMDSASGRERLSWAMQGFEAFVATYGVGIGVGSFRSSSMVSAVVGSTGIIGTVALMAYMTAVLAPWRAEAYRLDLDRDSALREAAATASILCLLPAVISSPLADPGLLFALLAGYALGGRQLGATVGASLSPVASRLEARRSKLRRRSA